MLLLHKRGPATRFHKVHWSGDSVGMVCTGLFREGTHRTKPEAGLARGGRSLKQGKGLGKWHLPAPLFLEESRSDVCPSGICSEISK